MCALKKKSARRRRYRVNLIKETYLYDTNEIAKLFGLHRNTVRHWSKEGLRPIDDRRPIFSMAPTSRRSSPSARKRGVENARLAKFIASDVVSRAGPGAISWR